MDRNGKKAKAVRGDGSNAERSDMTTQTRDALGRTAADTRAQGERAGGEAGRPASKGARGGGHP